MTGVKKVTFLFHRRSSFERDRNTVISLFPRLSNLPDLPSFQESGKMRDPGNKVILSFGPI